MTSPSLYISLCGLYRTTIALDPLPIMPSSYISPISVNTITDGTTALRAPSATQSCILMGGTTQFKNLRIAFVSMHTVPAMHARCNAIPDPRPSCVFRSAYALCTFARKISNRFTRLIDIVPHNKPSTYDTHRHYVYTCLIVVRPSRGDSMTPRRAMVSNSTV